jgi:hypothetical protein
VASKKYHKAYYDANKEKIKAQTKAYYEANKEQRKAYREANKKKIKVRMKAYYEANKENLKAQCKKYEEENKARKKAYLEANKEKIKARTKAYYQKNKKQILTRIKKYEEENKEKLKVTKKIWRKDNSDKVQAKNARRRALKMNGHEELSADDKFVIEECYELRHLRTKTTGIKWHVDHIIPLSKGGLHKPTNLQVVPATWNLQKNNNHQEKWIGKD